MRSHSRLPSRLAKVAAKPQFLNYKLKSIRGINHHQVTHTTKCIPPCNLQLEQLLLFKLSYSQQPLLTVFENHLKSRILQQVLLKKLRRFELFSNTMDPRSRHFASFSNYLLLFKIANLEIFSVMKMKLALPLKQRLSLVDSSQDDSSSTDSTPQRRKIRSESKDQVILNKQTKPNISRPKPNAPLLGRKMHSKSKFPLNLSAESESCSSAMSSMESVRSSNSGGSVQSLVSSSESGAGCSMSTSSNSNLSLPASSRPILELRTHRSNILSSNKFTVLSPISDKSQEQSSEHGDSSSKTPKVSPTDHILASCCGMNPDDTENNNQEPAPFAMPKLQRKLMQKQYYHHHSSSAKNSIQGSDSGISMSSQDVQDMVELLKLPFDMPKLRRKTQHILRPASMPINDIAMLRGQDKYLSASMNNEAWPCPKPSDVSTGSTMDNYRFQICDNNVNRNNDSTFLNQSGSAAAETEIPHPAALPPPPPPGFADENNQFYLTEDEMESTTAQPVGIRQGN